MSYSDQHLHCTNYPDKVIAKKIHADTLDLLKEYGDQFEASLTLEAQLIAHRYGANMVLKNHAEEAMMHFKTSRTKSSSLNRLLMSIGGVLIGAFSEEIISEFLSGGIDQSSIFALIGFAGLIIIAWAIRR